jgi:hypothetical protein
VQGCNPKGFHSVEGTQLTQKNTQSQSANTREMSPTPAANTYKAAPSHIVQMTVKEDMLKVNPKTNGSLKNPTAANKNSQQKKRWYEGQFQQVNERLRLSLQHQEVAALAEQRRLLSDRTAPTQGNKAAPTQDKRAALT